MRAISGLIRAFRAIFGPPAAAVAVLGLWGCAHLRGDSGPPVAPADRSWSDQFAYTVDIEVSCGGTLEPWHRDVRGAGVAVGERRFLTAAHVVACPELPDVHVIWHGERIRVAVERESTEEDLARLVLWSAERYAVVPPTLGPIPPAGTQLTVSGPMGVSWGTWRGPGRMAQIWNAPGDSGSPVYVDDRLVGLVVAGDGRYAEIAPVPPSWIPRR